MTSLDRLRRDAKALRKAHRAGSPEALARVASVLGACAQLKHADALHVIARERGHATWSRLKFAHETERMDQRARAERLATALYHGQHWVTEALLAEDPELGRADFALACALYDIDHVRAGLARDPGLAVSVVRLRRPILHLAFSRHLHGGGDAKAMLAVAEALVAAGADVNDGYPAEPGSPHLLSALYGALGHGDNLLLAESLLQRGADPNDNESLYHATELGHLDGVRLLLRHGARNAGTNALLRMLDFDDAEGVRLLLEHGADPNEGVAPQSSGQPPTVIPALHQAARRMCSAAVAEILIAHGADGTVRYQGHTAHALARMMGNAPVARALERAGQAVPLDHAETLLAQAAEGTVVGRLDPAQLTEESRRIMTRVLAYPGRLGHVRRLADLGIDPDWTEEMGMPAIHVAGWEGHSDVVAWLLTLGPDLTRKNDYGGDLMGTVIHGAEFCPARAGRDHLGCARLVLEAGAPLHRYDIDHCGEEKMVALLEDWAEAHPDRVIPTP